jgi:hypothetical protein
MIDMELILNGFEACSIHYPGLGSGGPENLDFFGPTWRSLLL